VVSHPFVEAGFSWSQLQDAFRLRRQAEKKSLDLFHAYFQWNLPLRRMRVPVVGHIYDLMPMAVRDLYLERYDLNVSRKIRLYEAYLKFALKRVDRVFTISEHTRSDLVRLTGFPESRTHVVYPAPAPGMKASEDESEIRAVRERFKLEGEYLLYVGGYDYRKNLETLLFAYARAREKDLPYPLVLAGGMDSPYGQRIQQMVEEAGPRSGLRPIGHVSDADLPALYSGARLVLYPSFYEGFGLPVLDAMAFGAPVITSNAASLPEAAGDAAVLLDPEDKAAWRDALLCIAGDEDHRNDLRARGLRHAAQFSWEKSAKKIIRVYEEMAVS
jgi:glycosyltransferase involved in cell wall biosynthesis